MVKVKRRDYRQFRKVDWVQNLYRSKYGRAYFFERQHRGEKIRESLGRGFDAASRRAVEINRAIDSGEWRKTTLRHKDTVSSFFESFLGSIEDRSPKTIASYRNRVSQFLSFLTERHPKLLLLGDVTRATATDYVEWRSKQRVTRSGKGKPTTRKSNPSSRTLKDDIVTLRTVFRDAVDRELIVANPFERVKSPKRRKETERDPQPLSEKQVRQLLAVADEYDQAKGVEGKPSTFRGIMRQMIHLYVLTGLRKEELMYLPWIHVDFSWGDHGIIHVRKFSQPVVLKVKLMGRCAERISDLARRRSATGRLFPSIATMRSVVPKNYADQEESVLMKAPKSAWNPDRNELSIRTRIEWKQKATKGSIPLVKQARVILESRRSAVTDSPFVFPHPDGGVLRSDPLPQFKKLAIQAGLPSTVYIHDLRHTFGFTLRDREVPLETIMGLMRHKNLEDTLIYARYTDRQGARALLKLEDFAC